jgi:hypothetical protein
MFLPFDQQQKEAKEKKKKTRKAALPLSSSRLAKENKEELFSFSFPFS